MVQLTGTVFPQSGQVFDGAVVSPPTEMFLGFRRYYLKNNIRPFLWYLIKLNESPLSHASRFTPSLLGNYKGKVFKNMVVSIIYTS